MFGQDGNCEGWIWRQSHRELPSKILPVTLDSYNYQDLHPVLGDVSQPPTSIVARCVLMDLGSIPMDYERSARCELRRCVKSITRKERRPPSILPVSWLCKSPLVAVLCFRPPMDKEINTFTGLIMVVQKWLELTINMTGTL